MGDVVGDMFLTVRSARAGDIKGESQAKGHEDEIVVHGWTWGMSQQVAAGSHTGGSHSGGQGGIRRSLKTLTVFKRLDKATTSLMAVLGGNDVVRTAILTMRTAGEGQQDFFKIKLENARIVDLDYEADENGRVKERVSFSFVHIDFEYSPQVGSGQLGASGQYGIDA